MWGKKGELSLNWMRSHSKLEALKSNFNECKGNVEYYQDKLARVQAKLMDKVEKYKDLNKKKNVMIES